MIKENEPDNPVLAICYDFDKTLSPDDMQAQGYIQSIDYEVDDFWRESNELSEKNEMDRNLAYMYLMAEKSRGKVLFTKETLHNDGAKVKLYPGVATWFDRINDYGEKKGVKVEHYIISSGLKEMIEGTEVADKFKKIYASSFYFDESGVAVWPAQVVNYTNKTQFLFRIEKGVLDINDSAVNEYFSPEEMRVPFRNMIYIGDSDTDIPCMKLVNSYGGHSIGVYNAETMEKTKVYKMMRDGRIRYFAPADYTEGKELDLLVRAIIDRTTANEALETLHYKYKIERIRADKGSNEEERKRTDLLIALDNSRSFASTHTLISELQEIDNWSFGEKEILFQIALSNSQVRYILCDWDVKTFYKKLIESMKTMTPYAQEVKNVIESDD